jgi:SAM-dependent methyltransferase
MSGAAVEPGADSSSAEGNVVGGSQHWQEVYSGRSTRDVSWFQPEPDVSLRLVLANTSVESPLVDVGSGTSYLVDRLLARGYVDVTLVDIAPSSLDEVSTRIGDVGSRLTCVVSDVLDWSPTRAYHLWHDRAVFHFLVDDVRRDRYVALVARTLRPGGVLVMGAFAEDGPSHCSGLPVRRYSVEELVATFACSFSFDNGEREVHVTPGGAQQPFNWVVFRRTQS